MAHINTIEPADFETTACPLCGVTVWQPYLKAGDLLYGKPGEFHLVRCAECRHVYLHPRPTLAAMASYYPKDYGPFREENSRPAAGSAAQGSPLRRLARSLPGLRPLLLWLVGSGAEQIPEVASSPKRALELGCAGGRFLKRLQDDGWQVQGIEPAEEAARRAHARGLDVHMGTLESAALPDSHFDAVFAWMVLEHLHDPRSVLQEVHRVLKPGGWFQVSVPNIGCWEPRVFGKYWYALQLPTHLHHFSSKSLTALFEQSEFTVRGVVHQRNVNNLVGSAGLWLRDKLPNRRFGSRLIRWTDDPTIWGLLALAPLARILAFLRQGGRLTVLAQNGEEPS